jgi:hypothetical protein
MELKIFLYQVLGEGAFGDVKLLFNKEYCTKVFK